MNFEKHQDDVRNFLDKKFDEMKAEMGLPIHGGKIGCSLDDSLVFERIPRELPIKLEGFFVDLSGKVHAEVMSYSTSNGLVVINVTNTDEGVVEPMLTTIDYALFAMMFVRTPVVGVSVS